VRGFARIGLNSSAIRCGAYPHIACSAQHAVLCACPESVGVTRVWTVDACLHDPWSASLPALSFCAQRSSVPVPVPRPGSLAERYCWNLLSRVGCCGILKQPALRSPAQSHSTQHQAEHRAGDLLAMRSTLQAGSRALSAADCRPACSAPPRSGWQYGRAPSAARGARVSPCPVHGSAASGCAGRFWTCGAPPGCAAAVLTRRVSAPCRPAASGGP